MSRTASSIMTREQDRELNLEIGEILLANRPDETLVKRAENTVDSFTRTRVREEGFWRKVMDPVKIQNSDLTRQVVTDKPCKVVDKEPNSPAAMSVPFGTLPRGCYIRGPRYLVTFDRIMTRRFSKEVDELRTWIMDIRQVITDNAIKDILSEEDSKFIGAVEDAIGAPDTPNVFSNINQWQTIYGGISRDTLLDAKAIMPSTQFHLEVDTAIINNVTINQVLKFGRDEMGGDMSQDIFRKGWTETEFMNMRWIITIKHELIPNDSMYFFADPKFIGKAYLLEDVALFMRREAFLMDWFAYETLGGAIAHPGGLVRVDFA